MVRIQFYSFSKFHWLGFKNTKPVYRWKCDHKNIIGPHKGKMAKTIKNIQVSFLKSGFKNNNNLSVAYVNVTLLTKYYLRKIK